ncbi:cytochrome P450 [Rhizodiscina lignyota]|uniref:Cytochrome P450 n=1 Tax=Rhizodiscina lignyota TaxID=1504668 RepID=A0A9P4I9U8_9PEZI|nr:cytochrome P450 [Rhizodiscina lignyota]
MAPQASFLGTGLTAVPIVLIAISACLFFLYRRFLPKPIPGIPYNEKAAKSLLGDIPALVKATQETQEIVAWLNSQLHLHNSPIAQVFTKPFSKPWVIVGDSIEAEDILTRRNHEFAKSTIQTNVFHGLVPKHHITMDSTPEFKQHRQLIQDLITPNFLHQITAPQIHARFSALISLWEHKMRLADGHPFSVKQDIYNAGMDTIWSAAFGLDSPVNATNSQAALLSKLTSVDAPSNLNEPIIFPEAPYPQEFTAVMELVDTLEVPLKSPVPLFAHWCVRQTRKYKNNFAIKEKVLKAEIDKRAVLLNGMEKKDFTVRCGLDDILRRELIAAEKQGRQPGFHTRTIYDETLGYVVGGSETTGTAINWAMKFFAWYPNIQKKLRPALREAFTQALKEGRNPSAQEITKMAIPYLDAVQEEIFRHSLTEAASFRRTLQEVEILGHRIPKGVDVWMMGCGPGYLEPSFDIPDSLRSPTTLASKSKIGRWDPKDIRDFKPERWLVHDGNGNVSFNPQAGPHLTFSLGPRGCWGRRMAYLEMRIVLVLIIWNFQMLDVPEELTGMEAIDKIAHQPQKTYVRLAKAGY